MSSLSNSIPQLVPGECYGVTLLSMRECDKIECVCAGWHVQMKMASSGGKERKKMTSRYHDVDTSSLWRKRVSLSCDVSKTQVC